MGRRFRSPAGAGVAGLGFAVIIRAVAAGYGPVEAVILVAGPPSRYNFSLAEGDAFVVGGDGWVVYNACGDIPNKRMTSLLKTGISAFIQWAKSQGWQIEIYETLEDRMPANLLERYRHIPIGYLEFLKKVKRCSTPDDKSWFISLDDYAETSKSAFKWNEAEAISLQAAENDEDWQRNIIQFWDQHLPIFFSVKDGYTYFAIKLSGHIGQVVVGNEPEFEETTKVSDSFAEFLDALKNGHVIEF